MSRDFPCDAMNGMTPAVGRCPVSGDLTARDVIAQGLDATDLGREGNRVPDYHPDDRDLMRDYTRWSDFTDRAEKLRRQRHKRAADAVLAALAAAGWRLERDDQWEWGREAPGDWTDVTEWGAGPEAQGNAEADWEENGGKVVRRRPAGEWEVAP